MIIDTTEQDKTITTTITLENKQDVLFHRDHFLAALDALEDVDGDKVVGIKLTIIRTK